jgi:hypothetical protein
MERLRSQVKPRREATCPRTHGHQEHLGAKKNIREALIGLYEPTFLVWGPIGRVIYAQM